MSVAPSEDPTLEPPEWVQCDTCDKWRQLPTEYVLTVQDSAWSCSEPGSGCRCAETCHGCNKEPCICDNASGCWQDSIDPDKYAFAFGAQRVPKGFSPRVKQKPAGEKYMEYTVYCPRCDAHATLDRNIETLRAKERMLLSGKGNGRTLEGWLRDHQGCNSDWSNLTPDSLSFKVPLGYRRYRSTKSPLYTPVAQASSASSQPSTSNMSIAGTSLAQSSACLAHPAHSDSEEFPISCPQSAHCAPPQHTEQMPISPSKEQMPISPLEEQADQEIPGPSHTVGNARTAPFSLDETVAVSLSPVAALAAQDPQANCPENSAAATANIKVAKPAVQAASTFMSGPSQGAAMLHCKSFRPPFSQTTVQCTIAGGNGVGSATCAAGIQHLHSAAGPDAATPKQDVTPSDLRQAGHPSALANGVYVKAEPEQASEGGTANTALPGVLAAPRGLNGPLLSRSQKRKASLSLKPQAEPIDLTMSDDDSADEVSGNAKRIKAELQECVHDHTDHADSLARMVQQLNNRDLKQTPITMEQLQNLQNAVDGVTELKALQPEELTHVLTSVGKLEPVQKIFVRRFLNVGSSLG